MPRPDPFPLDEKPQRGDLKPEFKEIAEKTQPHEYGHATARQYVETYRVNRPRYAKT